jgi:5-(carboxyamino)imidazole ribonucleotide synthase
MKVGVLGGGQLGRMLALAGYPLGFEFTFLDPAPDPPMGAVARGITAPYDDPRALEELANGSDVVTWEFENVSLASAEALAKRVRVAPAPAALAAKQDRLHEKRFFGKLGIPTARHAPASTREEFDAAVARIGHPVVVKSRSQGYDGKGQATLRDERHAARVWEALHGAPVIVEELVPFEREVSILAARGEDGKLAFYPLAENHHAGGILRHTIAPADGADALAAQAQEYATRVLEDLRYVGMLAIEFFVAGGKLIANEMAPRVHNSGHWTIEGAETSQFENHLRAIAGLPLGSTAARGRCAMVNILGNYPDPQRLAAIPGAHIHYYGKAPRPGRKLGHVTICEGPAAPPREPFDERVRRLLALVEEHLPR